MTRNAMAVVLDLMQTGLTVEQQALVGELYAALATRSYERERKRTQRRIVPEVPDKESTKESIYNNNKPLEGVQGKPLSRTITDEPLFEELWEVYPRKVGKGAARKAYRHALKRASHAEILAGAKRYAASKPDPQYTAHASTWLNADRWLDEPEKPKQSNILQGSFRPKVVEPEPPRQPRTPEEQARVDAQLAQAKARLLKRP